MKRISLIIACFLALILIVAFACISTYRSENNFAPSPNGKWVASVYHVSVDIPLGPESIGLSHSVALKIRRFDGKQVRQLPIAKAKEPYQVGYGYVDLAWSPDSKHIAVRNCRNLSVVDVSSGKRKTVERSSASFRWLDDSHLLYVRTSPKAEALISGPESVNLVFFPTGETQTLFEVSHAAPFHTSTSSYHNQLSADGNHYACIDKNRAKFIALQNKTAQEFHVEMSPSFCWWTDCAKACLISGLREIKSDKASAQNLSLQDVVWLFDEERHSLTELTNKLRLLNKHSLAIPRPQAPSRVWSADGKWFLVSGSVERKNPAPGLPGYMWRHWICQVNPWATACIQEKIGDDFHNPSISPKGNYIAVFKAKGAYAKQGDVYITEVLFDAEGTITLKEPILIVAKTKGTWFWSADGNKIIMFRRGKFTVHNIRQGD